MNTDPRTSERILEAAVAGHLTASDGDGDTAHTIVHSVTVANVVYRDAGGPIVTFAATGGPERWQVLGMLEWAAATLRGQIAGSYMAAPDDEDEEGGIDYGPMCG